MSTALFQRALDATFTRLGVVAVLDPDGVARAVRVMPAQEDELRDFAGARLQSRGETYEIRATEFDGFGDNAVLEVGGARRRVRGHRAIDARRLKILLDTVAV